jgi:hypothetical protein
MGQKGYIFKKDGSWFLRYRDDVIVDDEVRRVQQCKRLARVCRPISREKGLARPSRGNLGTHQWR